MQPGTQNPTAAHPFESRSPQPQGAPRCACAYCMCVLGWRLEATKQQTPCRPAVLDAGSPGITAYDTTVTWLPYSELAALAVQHQHLQDCHRQGTGTR